MTPTDNRRCKACTSERRAEINGRLLNGETTRAVAEWLKGLGETIHHSSLADHKRAHLNTRGEAGARLADQAAEAEAQARLLREKARDERAVQEPAFEAAVQDTLDEIATLDEIRRMAMRVARAMEAVVVDGVPETSQVTLFLGSMKQAASAAVERHELLNGKQVNVDATVTGPGIYIPAEVDD